MAMTHKIILLAKQVLLKEGDYPEVLLTQARYLVGRSDAHRMNIQQLWDRHGMLRVFNAAKRAQPAAMTYVRKSMAANHAVKLAFGTENLNEFHIAKNSLMKLHADNAMAMNQFKASLQVLEFSDVALMLRYLVCVNAKRFNDTLDEVGFLRWAGSTYTAEILAWRLLKSM